MVSAFMPLERDNLLAALPVGAMRRTFFWNCRTAVMMALTNVVFPVPGPPVMTSTPDSSAFCTASFWRSARER